MENTVNCSCSIYHMESASATCSFGPGSLEHADVSKRICRATTSTGSAALENENSRCLQKLDPTSSSTSHLNISVTPELHTWIARVLCNLMFDAVDYEEALIHHIIDKCSAFVF